MTSNDTTRAFMRRGRTRVLAIATSGVVLGSLVAAAPIFAGVAGAASLGTAVASPANVCASQTTQVALTIDGFGSARYVYIAAPSGFTVTSATSDSGTPSVTSGIVRVQDPASFPLTVTMSVTAPASGTGLSWTVQGDTEDEGYPDATDNSGNSGGDSSDDWAATAATTVDAGCHLAFTADPATTALSGGSAPISSVLGGDYSSPVAVQVQDSGNNPEPVSTDVTLAISADGPLTAGSAATTSGGTAPIGTAAFTSLANGHSGTNLTLTATAPGLGSATSGSFDIYDSGTVCSGSCDTSPAPGFSLSADGSGFLAASLPTFTLSCSALRYGLYPGIPGTTTLGFTYINGGAKSVTFYVAKSLLTTLKAKLLALHYMVCYTSPTQFRTVFKLKAQPDPTTTALVNDGQTWYTGLLPDCEDTGGVAPCVQSRHIVTTGDLPGVYVQVLAPAGDPFGR
jgi:hypothetical protein